MNMWWGDISGPFFDTTEYHRLSDLQRREVYLTRSPGAWEILESGATPGAGLCVLS